jgi:plasmid stabilization system protein ParE
MKYWVEITETAWAEVEKAYNWLAGQSPQSAIRWKRALLQAVDSLEMDAGSLSSRSGKYRMEKGNPGTLAWQTPRSVSDSFRD